MDQLTGEYKKQGLSPPALPSAFFLHVTGPGCWLAPGWGPAIPNVLSRLACLIN